MENVENLVKVARELKKDERVGTIGTAALKGAKIGGGLGVLGGAIAGAKHIGGVGGAIGGALGAGAVGGIYGGGLGMNAGLVRALYRSARGHKSVHPNELKDN